MKYPYGAYAMDEKSKALLQSLGLKTHQARAPYYFMSKNEPLKPLATDSPQTESGLNHPPLPDNKV